MQMHTKLFPVRRCSHWPAGLCSRLGGLQWSSLAWRRTKRELIRFRSWYARAGPLLHWAGIKASQRVENVVRQMELPAPMTVEVQSGLTLMNWAGERADGTQRLPRGPSLASTVQ